MPRLSMMLHVGLLCIGWPALRIQVVMSWYQSKGASQISRLSEISEDLNEYVNSCAEMLSLAISECS